MVCQGVYLRLVIRKMGNLSAPNYYFGVRELLAQELHLCEIEEAKNEIHNKE